MGTWGTGIGSNDTYADIFEEFFDLYNDGLEVNDITKKLVEENQEIIDDSYDSASFWFAIANAQWECKALDKEILLKVEHIIESGEDLKAWRESNAAEADIRARAKVLSKFFEKLKTEKPKPRKRAKKRLYNSIFKKGDCLIYKMDNGNYGGAFVLKDEQGTKVGANHIAITTIDKSSKPTLRDFEQAEVLIQRVNQKSFKNQEITQSWIEQPQIGAFYAVIFNKKDTEIEIIGQLPIYKDYKVTPESHIGFGWITLNSIISSNTEYIKKNGSPKSKLKLSRWIGKSWIKRFR